MKRRSMILLAFILLFTVCMAFVACNGKTIDKLESEDVVAEGKFAKGVTLSVSKTETTDQNYSTAISKIEGKNFDRNKVAVYDISLVKDDAKVQPDGKVKITMPAPFESPKGYVTYHLADGENAEELATTFADGKITFETDGFSYFVIAGKTALPDNPNIPGKNFFAYADTNTQGSIKANGEAVGKGGYSAVLTAGTEVELEAVPSDGYEFVGWHKKAKVTGNNEYYEVSGSKAKFKYNGEEEMFVYARFDVVTYGITVNLNGGTLADGETIPETYDIETETITLPAPTKENATFAGWENADGETVTAITKGTTGEITLTAKWKAPTFVRVDKDKNPDENGEYILFGSYPQTAIDRYDTTTLSALNALAGTNPSDGNNGKWTSYKYYYAKLLTDGTTETSNEIDFMWYIDVNYKGERYRGVYFDKYRPVAAKGSYNVLKDGKTETISCTQITNRYFVDKVYWFKYEPILWKIIQNKDGKAQLLCMTAVDCQPYTLLIRYDSAYLEDKERNDRYNLCYNDSPGVPNGILGTDYEYSTIRAWLNNYFYEKAFDSAQKSIVCDTVVDNVTGEVGRNTTEKVFIPSINEVKNTGDLDRKASDYAKSQGTDMQYGGTYCYSWYLRDTYYVLRFQDPKDVYVQDHKRYYQLCSVRGGTAYDSISGVPCFTSAEGTSNAVVPSLWITL